MKPCIVCKIPTRWEAAECYDCRAVPGKMKRDRAGVTRYPNVRADDGRGRSDRQNQKRVPKLGRRCFYDRAEIVRLLGEGLTCVEVGRRVGCSAQHAGQVRKTL